MARTTGNAWVSLCEIEVSFFKTFNGFCFASYTLHSFVSIHSSSISSLSLPTISEIQMESRWSANKVSTGNSFLESNTETCRFAASFYNSVLSTASYKFKFRPEDETDPLLFVLKTHTSHFHSMLNGNWPLTTYLQNLWNPRLYI